VEILRHVVESRLTERVITVLIIVNAVTLGLETSPAAMARFGPVLIAVDRLVMSVFVVEIAARLLVHRLSFFRNPWNIFDFVVVAIAALPATGSFSVLRALRVLRVLRIITVFPSLRRVVGALVGALPGMGSIMLLLTLVFYVFSVMATKLFAASFPEWFGSIGASAYTLFQVMTLESWSMGIVRPVMEVYPLAWTFFVPFILFTTFTVLNLFIGIIVNAMQSEHEMQVKAEREELEAERQRIEAERQHGEAIPAALAEELRELRREIRELHGSLRRDPAV
jgi:voltage-gated sodium channel